MAFRSLFEPASQATDAAFRAWTQHVDAMLTGPCGLVQTADTGQMDLAAGTVPVVSPQYQGYRIYRMNDALQASAPVFLKVEYGWGGASTTTPGIGVTIGSGTNGAGSITGAFWTTFALYLGGAVAAPAPWMACGGEGYASLMVALEGTFRGMALCLERWRNSDGSYNGTGLCGLAMANGASFGFTCMSVEFGQTGAHRGTTSPFYPVQVFDRTHIHSLVGRNAVRAYIPRRTLVDARALVPPPKSFVVTDSNLAGHTSSSTPWVMAHQIHVDGAWRPYATAFFLYPTSQYPSYHNDARTTLALLME